MPTLSCLWRYCGQPLPRFGSIEARPELIGPCLEVLREFEAIDVGDYHSRGPEPGWEAAVEGRMIILGYVAFARSD